MSRRALLLAAAAASLGLAGAASVPPAAEAMPALRAARVQVGALEFRLQLSRLKVSAGKVTVQLVNYGEDDHDLRFRRIGGTRVYRIPPTSPGGSGQVAARLRPGTFRLWCSIKEHSAAGMHAKLRVVRG